MKLACDFQLTKGSFQLEVRMASDSRHLGLFGPSGAGKSLLVRTLAGLEQAHGRLQVDDDVWLDSNEGRFCAAHERRVGWVPQQGALLPHLDVQSNLKLSSHFVSALFDDAVGALGLAELLSRNTESLSGGEQKRVAIGRALLSDPRWLLLDEPLSGLDWQAKHDLLAFLMQTLRTFDVPVLFVSHEPFEIGVVCDEVWVQEHGRIVAHGTPEEVFLRPGNATTAQLAGLENKWSGTVSVLADGSAKVMLGALDLCADYTGPAGNHVVAVLAATEVLLTRSIPTSTSARNVWLARVTSINRQGREVAVHLGCNAPGPAAGSGLKAVPLTAIITPAALSDLDLKSGDTVYALFKASAVRVFSA